MRGNVNEHSDKMSSQKGKDAKRKRPIKSYDYNAWDKFDIVSVMVVHAYTAKNHGPSLRQWVHIEISPYIA